MLLQKSKHETPCDEHLLWNVGEKYLAFIHLLLFNKMSDYIRWSLF